MTRLTHCVALALSCLSIAACDGTNTLPQLGPEHFQIDMINQHPFLIDHDRECVVTVDGKEKERFPLYPNAGSGFSYANLYREDSGSIILIDVNGTWFFFEAGTGKLQRKEWQWKSPTPNGYLGTYLYDKELNQYIFTPANDRAESDPYSIKDPNDL